jgi:hypothetical protein
LRATFLTDFTAAAAIFIFGAGFFAAGFFATGFFTEAFTTGFFFATGFFAAGFFGMAITFVTGAMATGAGIGADGIGAGIAITVATDLAAAFTADFLVTGFFEVVILVSCFSVGEAAHGSHRSI